MSLREKAAVFPWDSALFPQMRSWSPRIPSTERTASDRSTKSTLRTRSRLTRPLCPPMPAQHQGGHQQGSPRQNQGYSQGNGQYYEDYSEGYAPDAPYFDPASNALVMPYAQPAARRATDPSSFRTTFPGSSWTLSPVPRLHGWSQNARPLVPVDLPDLDLLVPNQMGPGSRPGSSASAAYGQASGRFCDVGKPIWRRP